MEILIGIICGVLLSLLFSLGPAFFSLIQNSIHHGFKKAVSFAAGVSLSDILIVMLMLTVLSNLDFSDLTAILHNVYVSIIGSVATAVFAILTWRSKVKKATVPDSRLKFSVEHVTHHWQLLLSGFLLNVLNPLIWIYWLSIITFLSAEMNLGVRERYFFFFLLGSIRTMYLIILFLSLFLLISLIGTKNLTFIFLSLLVIVVMVILFVILAKTTVAGFEPTPPEEK